MILIPALTALLVYGLTLCRTVYFGDSAELAAAAAALGIAHPPGYPLYLLLGRLAVAATPGEPAFAVNLLSALAAAVTAGCAAALAAHLGARLLAAICAGLLVIGSRMVWSQATVAEVYTVHAALALGFLVALAADEYRPRDSRILLLAAYLLGLGLAHHLSIVYVGLAGLLLLAARRRLPWRAAFPAVALVAMGLSLYGVLVVRSRFDPPLDWGNPETASRLIDHVTARPYHFLVGKLRGPDVLRRLGQVCGNLATDLHPLFMGPAILGLASLRRRPAWLAALLVVIGALVAHAVAYGITDIAGHLLPAAVVLAVASGLGFESLLQFLERTIARSGAPGRTPALRTVAPLLLCGAAALPIALHWRDSDLSKHRSAREFGENLLSSLPAGATLFAEGDNQVFILAYLKTTSQIRPDVTVIDGDGNLLADFYGMRGEHGPPPAVDFRTRRLEVESAELQRWFSDDPHRPVFYSGRSNIPSMGPFVQETSGLLMRVRPKGSPAADSLSADSSSSNSKPSTAGADPWAGIHTEAIRRDVIHGDALTREVAARYWVRRGEAAFEHGDPASMQAAFDSALAVAPQNADLSSYLGAFHAQNGMIDRAIPLLERAVRLNPLSVRGWTNLGFALIKSGRKAEGMAALRESLRIQPDQEQVAATLRQLTRGGG